MKTAKQNYGDVKAGSPYKVISRGNDWILISLKGKPVYVPSQVFEGKYEKVPSLEDYDD